ncbi:MAG: hypothetical protein EWM72_00145 [Nitrospira sp.]|nr:MAG: hypothetical protein EWM72_00145 [Nitrospira sp.]
MRWIEEIERDGWLSFVLAQRAHNVDRMVVTTGGARCMRAVKDNSAIPPRMR